MGTKLKQSIGIFGFGHMGQAIFKLLKTNKKFSNCRFFVCSLGLDKVKGAERTDNLKALAEKSDIIFLCVKPQEFKKIAPEKIGSLKTIIISIMAGVKIDAIRKTIGAKRIIRAMPNLALAAGKSMTGWYADKERLTRSELRTAKIIFDAFGKQIFLKNEKQLNAVTAVSGSGPAYVFLFMDALVNAAMKLGFQRSDALTLVKETIAGSLKYSENENDLAELVKKVTSKKGTTEAALKSLDVVRFYKQWERAVKKAYERAEELSS
jgi:pyrroline-5-carboxylate reductase